MDCSLPESSVHGFLQARIQEWVAISFSRASSQCRNQTQVSCIVGRFFTNWARRETMSVDLPLLLSPRNFTVSGLKFESVICFELIFVYAENKCSVSFVCGYPFSLASFIEETVISPLNILSFSKINWSSMCHFISRLSILLHWSMCLVLCQYYAVLIIFL